MKPTMTILDRIRENSKSNKEEIFTRLYRYMLRPDLYHIAYKNLYANEGASTEGVDNDTADGFSQEKIENIIQSLSDDTYNPKPVRRTYIQKKGSSKKRPLGIPTFTDKLVQEVLRMILEAVYEPLFSNYSHGFRPNRSCHTALKSLKKEFTGATWFIEGDIKACFDSIDHHVLTGIIGSKIKDAKFIQLIWKFLKAGYMEDWKYNATHSGCPQGGIVSPILSNIYLNELDKFAEKLAKEFQQPRKLSRTAEYAKASSFIDKTRKQLKTAKGQEKSELLRQMKTHKTQLRKIPYTSKTDKVMKYIRYADDFIIGINGDREDCEHIKQEFSNFISQSLKMELSDEKTLITHSNQYARFLGYDIRVRRCDKVKRSGNRKMRTLNYTVELNVPFADKTMPFLFDKMIIKQSKDGKIEPAVRKYLLRCTNLEIVESYNSELRGICNYYGIASNFTRLDYFAYLMEYSCLKTLAGKHKSTTSKMKDKFHIKNGGWGIPYSTKKENQKFRTFAKYTDCKDSDSFNDEIIEYAIRHAFGNGTTLENRLSAKICELCGKTDVPLAMHHVNKVKNLKGKQQWEIIMIAKRRKTLAVCKNCHHKIHHPCINLI
jgi:group II intron reverse transcriptase/maturase